MKRYESIESVWQRDPQTGLLLQGVVREPIWAEVTMWSVYEKVDGMNIRVIFTWDDERGVVFEVRGRTDKANIPADLVDAIRDQLQRPGVGELLGITAETPRTVTLYGEGFGPGIQKGAQYGDKKEFILFDVLTGNPDKGRAVWSEQTEVGEIANRLNIRRVPLVQEIPLWNIPTTHEQLGNLLPYSIVSHGRRAAEGIVARPKYEMQDRFGNRIMWKLTFRDMPHEAVNAKEEAFETFKEAR